ncbi:right-handed parallel beta-helix repeat-containing protein [Microvirga calopogonii]|uniref:right-handed parallel beta-helix repeat-containing protein n=1 Tax=Microvirga calopogonii TaxID=2078013 RepID=UPI0013B419B1|nr:right-handed parallel beta-helix repeat-containing protein [Microvirga calopogonii]
MAFGKILASAFLTATILQIVPGKAEVLYVSVSGNDSNPGTMTLPLRSITKAAAEAKPGTRVTVLGGLYKEIVVITAGGTPELPVVFEPAPGEQVTIDGEAAPPDTNLVQISASNITFQGFTVRNSTRSGIAAWGTHDVKIANNKVSGSKKAGIWVGHSEVGQSHSNLIEGNEVWNNCLENVSPTSEGGWPQGISLQASDKSAIIGNRVYRNYGEGIGTLSTHDVRISQNIAFDNYSVNIYLDNAPSTVVQDNKVYHTYAKEFYRNGLPAKGIMIANEYTEIELPSRNINVTQNILGGVGRVTYGDYQRASGLIDSVINVNTILDKPESLW